MNGQTLVKAHVPLPAFTPPSAQDSKWRRAVSQLVGSSLMPYGTSTDAHYTSMGEIAIWTKPLARRTLPRAPGVIFS